MKERVITAVGIGIVGIPIILFSEFIVYPLFLGLLSAIAVWELLRVFALHKNYVISVPAYAISGILPVLAHDSIVSTDSQREYLLIVAAILFAFLLYLAAVTVLQREHRLARLDEGESEDGIIGFGDAASVFISVTYVTVSFTSMALTRYMTNGAYIFGLVFVTAWMSDVFAYFTGRLLGKHKLAPRLSPKKTVEGSIGGIIFAVLGCLLYGLIIDSATDLEAKYAVLALIGFVLSVISQIGDIWASLIKREHGIKDYSSMLPGHGGVMDRFDSILAIATVLMAISMLVPPFV